MARLARLTISFCILAVLVAAAPYRGTPETTRMIQEYDLADLPVAMKEELEKLKQEREEIIATGDDELHLAFSKLHPRMEEESAESAANTEAMIEYWHLRDEHDLTLGGGGEAEKAHWIARDAELLQRFEAIRSGGGGLGKRRQKTGQEYMGLHRRWEGQVSGIIYRNQAWGRRFTEFKIRADALLDRQDPNIGYWRYQFFLRFIRRQFRTLTPENLPDGLREKYLTLRDEHNELISDENYEVAVKSSRIKGWLKYFDDMDKLEDEEADLEEEGRDLEHETRALNAAGKALSASEVVEWKKRSRAKQERRADLNERMAALMAKKNRLSERGWALGDFAQVKGASEESNAYRIRVAKYRVRYFAFLVDLVAAFPEMGPSTQRH